jgi:hypothetical protein
MKNISRALLLFSTVVLVNGMTRLDGTQPQPPSYPPPHGLAQHDGGPNPPPHIPPTRLDGTAPVPPTTIPPKKP